MQVTVEDQGRECEDCYRHDQDQRCNAIHAPHLQNVCFDVCEVEPVGKSNAGKIGREDYAAKQHENSQQ